ncbi:glycosyltransferase family 4 protein [Dyadobacter arcticus]|uniref:PIN domain-containing protein n=1 Tax=Dyadobacter arcticus TaxID=1078754 RepID=A0ABX0UUF1_9BACT|nr:glycosyltransferase family 4 protein [Dyadobacter arcticus]NIJ55425.1 hypothetical protein [Dyadobacter arcticus]
MKFIDTNILYYKFSNSYPDTISGTNIVSISALEFLKNIEKSHPNRSKYYVPYRFGSHDFINREYLKLHGKRPFRSSYSDSISFEFKQNANNYVLYNNESIANAINEKQASLYQASIFFLEKQDFKELKSKFKFIIENNLVCHPLTKEDIERSYQLLDTFTDTHNMKPDFRNSWNDILILSKVINSGGTLISSDKELNKFAAEVYGAKVVAYDNIMEYSFPCQHAETVLGYTKFESKGYINQGWAYRKNKGK